MQPLLTADLIARVKDTYPRCLYVETCANLLGVAKRTWNTWTRRGAQERRRRDVGKAPDPEEDLYVAFVVALQEADAAWQAGMIDVVTAAAKAGEWTAAMRLLEGRHPDLWSRDTQRFHAQERKIRELQDGYDALAAQCAELLKRHGAGAGRARRTAEAGS